MAPTETDQAQAAPQDTVAVIGTIRKRAAHSRTFAKLLILANVIIVMTVLGFFFSKSSYTLNTNLASSIEMSGLGFSYSSKQAIEPPQELVSTSTIVNDELEKLREQNRVLGQQANERAFMINTIGEAILRFGSVLLAVYLIQIFVNFTRYHFRISDHLFSVADAMELSSSDFSKLEALVTMLSPKHIDFGASPKSINKNISELIKEAISKLPTGNK